MFPLHFPFTNKPTFSPHPSVKTFLQYFDISFVFVFQMFAVSLHLFLCKLKIWMEMQLMYCWEKRKHSEFLQVGKSRDGSPVALLVKHQAVTSLIITRSTRFT